MRQSSLPATPLFADWLFTTQVHITEEQRLELLQEVRHTPKNKRYFGFEGGMNSLGKNLNGLRHNLSNTFFNNAISHFNIDTDRFTVQSVESRVIGINPGHVLPYSSSIKKWYQCVCFLDVAEKGCKFSLRRDDARMHTTPRGIEMPEREYAAKPLDVFFWPAYIPWGLTPNGSNRPTVIFTNAFTFIKTNEQATLRRL